MTPRWPKKDPDELLDYSVDWSRRLDGDTILESVWDVPDGLVTESHAHDAASTTIWLSAGVAGRAYRITNRVRTHAGRIMDQTVHLAMEER